MDGKSWVILSVLILFLFIILPFPFFFFLMVLGGGIAGWIHQGNKMQQEQIQEDEAIDEFYEDAFEQLYQQEKEGREGDPITGLNGDTIYAKDMTLDEWKYYQEWKEYREWKDRQSGF